jgi:dTDP-4-dehydrorhamnose reductase
VSSLSLIGLDVEESRALDAAVAGPVLIVGAAGQLGQTMVACLRERWPVVALTRAELDLSDAAAVRREVDARRPAVIVNCAGYNEVDRAEDEPEVALTANAIVVLTLARAAAAAGALFVHYSSDFVFSGDASEPYREDDRPDPRSLYAASKLLGEWFAADAGRYYVLRVESLFGGVARRKSSLDRIIDSIARGAPVRVFTDRVVSPSYAWDVAAATGQLLQRRPVSGVYHCVNTGAATWHDVAVEVRRQVASDSVLEPITMNDVALRAARPRYCALSNARLQSLGIEMPTWQDALGRHVNRELEGIRDQGSGTKTGIRERGSGDRIG